MNILIDPEDEVKAFAINISAIDTESENKNTSETYSVRNNKQGLNDDGGEIGRLRNKINQIKNDISDLEDEIEEYDKEENFDFNYKMLIEQGL